MKTENLDRIRVLREMSSKLKEFHKIFNTKYAPNSRCDKKGYGFSEDNRFRSFNIVTGFDSWAGYYGNSGCSKVLSLLDDKIMNEYFIKALNIHQYELFITVARLLEEESVRLVEEAEKEIEGFTTLLTSIKENVQC